MKNLIIDFEQIQSEEMGRISYTIPGGNFDRVYIKNANHNIVYIAASVNTKRGILIEECTALSIMGVQNLPIKVVGGIQVAGDIKLLRLSHLNVLGGEHGLLMSQHTGTEKYGHVKIDSCMFSHNLKEGIYIGKSLSGDEDEKPPMIESVEIIQTICRENLWDGCQIGNTKKVEITDCEFVNNGLAEYAWQDCDLTINPGCERVDIKNTKFKTSQFLSPKTFIR